MSEESSFAPPPFDPAQALATLARQLRDLRLAERAGVYEWKGQPAVRLQALDASVRAELARQPARTPQWTAQELKTHADVRRFVDQVRQQLARWDERD